MGQNIVYMLLVTLTVKFCSPAHIPEEYVNSTSIGDLNNGDCVIENIIYANGGKVPSPGPCEECHCQSSEVVCSMIKCKPNTSGCKIIQQSNQCCPQYKCECEFNDRIYNNGERLERPDDPCWVCYCKGGEVMCTTITCYERNDCTAYYVSGQCCPKYDHCPVEPNGNGNVSASANGNKREMQPWLLTVSANNQPSSTTPTPNNNNNKYPQTIKVIEILPTQSGQVQKITPGATIVGTSHNDEEIVQVLSGITIAAESVTSIPDVSREINESTSVEDKEESEKLDDLYSSTTISSDIKDINGGDDVNSSEENVTDTIEETSSLDNRTDVESIKMINDQEEQNPVQGQRTTINQIEDKLILQTDQQQSTISASTNKGEEDMIKVEPTTAFEFISETNERSSMLTAVPENSSESVEEQSTELSAESFSEEHNNTEPVYTVTSESNESPEWEGISASNVENISISSAQYKHTKQDDNNSTEIFNEPDSVKFYTTIVPDKFQNSNEIELNTENNDIDTTEGSGYSVISGWIYEDVTSEVNNGSIEYSAEQLNEVSSSTERNLNEEISSPSTIIEQTSSSSSEESTSSSEETTESENKKQKSSSSMPFPSILKLNDQIQFLKIQNQQQNSYDNENSQTIAKIGIYNPEKPNDTGNLLTVVKENNLELEEQLANKQLNDKQEENYTPHILLTPNDLKTLAEILIHEKIMPPYNQNGDNSNNAIDQRSVEFNSEENNVTLNSTESSLDIEIDETIDNNNTTDKDGLVEIIDVNKITNKTVEDLLNETTSVRPEKLTNEESWAQSVLNNVYNNILLPIQGIELIDRNDTSPENNTKTSEENQLLENLTLTEFKDETSFENITELNDTEVITEITLLSSTSSAEQIEESSEDNQYKTGSIEETSDNIEDSKHLRIPRRSINM